jgi:hypothetical protein
MRLYLMDYPKHRNVEVGDFCELAKKQWDEMSQMMNKPVLVIHCHEENAEEIARYFEDRYPEVLYTTVAAVEEIPDGDVELKPGDLELAREALNSLESQHWAKMTVIRHGIPRLRAEKAVGIALKERQRA